jgi:GT2 family glycosyltransferase
MESTDPPDYFLLLNADTLVHPHALDALVEFMDQHPNVGIAGSQLVSPDGIVLASPFRFFSIASVFDRGLRLGVVSKLLSRWAAVPPNPGRQCQADWVSGASMIIRRQVVEQIGPLDEDLYTYFDDIDYCWNARKAGWLTWYVPESRVTHLEGASTGITAKVIKRRPRYWFQARRRYYLKNYGAIYSLLADAAFIVGFALWRMRRVLQRKPDNDPPLMLRDFICNSLFFTGFKLRAVENPALVGTQNPVSSS